MSVEVPDYRQIARRKRGRIKVLAWTIALGLIGLAVLAAIYIVIPANHYGQAEDFWDAGDYNGAANEFAKAGQWKDSAARLAEAAALNMSVACNSSDDFWFGVYQGVPMAWEVVDQENDAHLMVSKYVIDSMAYHQGAENGQRYSFLDTSLGQWLNSEFLDSFTPEQQALLVRMESLPTAVPSAVGGRDSIVEEAVTAAVVLPDGQQMRQLDDEVGHTRSSDGTVSKDSTSWWLRSAVIEPDSDEHNAGTYYFWKMHDDEEGEYWYGSDASSGERWMGVRPAVWVSNDAC
jgi:hypothetical protein